MDSFTHWLFNDDSIMNIALVHFHRPIELSELVGLAHLPRLSDEHSSYENYFGMQVSYSGYNDKNYHFINFLERSSGCLNFNDPAQRNSICADSSECEKIKFKFLNLFDIFLDGSSADGGDFGSPYFVFDSWDEAEWKPTIVGVHYASNNGKHYGWRVSSFIQQISRITGAPLRP